MAHVDPAVTGISPSATLPLAADESALPPFSVPVVLTEARPQTWIAVVVLVAAALYLYGVYRLRLRGDRWPIARTAAFVGAGLGSIASVTVTGIGTYDTTLLSVHMVQHMVLSMIAPIFLALGAPVTLALRTLIGAPRRWLLALVHSRYARFVTHPLVAVGLFVINPFVLYFTDLYRLSLENEFFHEFVHAHFLITGCVFFWPLLGLDPLPRRWPYPARGLLMVLSVPFHTVLGLTIMQSTTLLGGDWYPSLQLGWADPWADQKVAGGILWAGGEFVSVFMLGVLFFQWIRYAERETRRIDRELDRQDARRSSTAAQIASVGGGTEGAAQRVRSAGTTTWESWRR